MSSAKFKFVYRNKAIAAYAVPLDERDVPRSVWEVPIYRAPTTCIDQRLQEPATPTTVRFYRDYVAIEKCLVFFFREDGMDAHQALRLLLMP